MARYRRRDALEERLAEALDVDGRTFTVDLIAKRATGVQGYRTTLAFLEREGAGSFFVDLEPAESKEEAGRRAEELAADPVRLRRLLEGELGEGGEDGPS